MENIPQKRKKSLDIFVCGPTVYDYSHIGHARTYIAFDTIIRFLKSQKIPVYYLQNITDIDDKIIARAKEQKIDPKKLAGKFEKEYYKDMKALNINSVKKYARATDYIPQIIKQVKTLMKKSYAYKIEGDGIYFDLSKFPEYGKLSKRTSNQAEDAVSRIDESVKKKNKGDFALWKFSIENEPSWKSPFGDGRPGWHIEDTAISEKFFGPQYDLHGGAVDLKFPHHESEIAQQEAASGKKPFVKIWMHTGFLLINGEKMSKSLGNFTTIKDFLEIYPADVLRFIIVSHHYRSPIDYSQNLATQASASLRHIYRFNDRLSAIKNKKGLGKQIKDILVRGNKVFTSAMSNDFNTPKAIAGIFDVMRLIEPKIWTLSRAEAKYIKKFLENNLDILGIKLPKTAKIPTQITKIVKDRELLRSSKQFAQADVLRKKIDKLGYIIEDTPQGPIVLKI